METIKKEILHLTSMITEIEHTSQMVEKTLKMGEELLNMKVNLLKL